MFHSQDGSLKNTRISTVSCYCETVLVLKFLVLVQKTKSPRYVVLYENK